MMVSQFQEEELPYHIGIIPNIEKTGIELGVNLAISLHAVNDELRNKLVPINKKYNLEKLIKSVEIILNYLILEELLGNMLC